ncbi:MAG: PqqD family peptide modification chaperone, partial [Bacteroidales bacterium]|nr:PqqD family peptide modification chaperone [Bacteroidales bacterium]
MNYFERRRVLKEMNTMDLVPVRTRGHDISDGKVIIFFPKFEGQVFEWFAPSTQKVFFKIKLDELGTAVYESMDGIRNVQQVCDRLISGQNLSEKAAEEMEERVSKFVMDL